VRKFERTWLKSSDADMIQPYM